MPAQAPNQPVNLALLSSEETTRPLPRSDRRAEHILHVLRCAPGDSFDVGLINGPRGKATLRAIESDGLHLEFSWGDMPPPPDPITLLLGLPRPQTARDILREATTLGVAAMNFVVTEKTEPSYAQSTLWRDGEWRRHLIAGAEQAFATQVPEVRAGETLATALAQIQMPRDGVRLALDNYEANALLASCEHLRAATELPHTPLMLAFGPERGWSAADRAALRDARFSFVHLGSRVLRLETAVIAALALAKAARGTL